jgi:cell division protein FtsB
MIFFRVAWDIFKLALVIAAMAAGWAAWHVDALARLNAGYEERNDYQRRLVAAQAEIKRLRAERVALALGGFAAEKTAREQYRYAKPGERLLVFEVIDLASRFGQSRLERLRADLHPPVLP